jgi:hypothetical protein
VVGAVIIVFVCVIAIPIGVMWTGAAIAAIFGATLKSHAEATHPDSELIETNY